MPPSPCATDVQGLTEQFQRVANFYFLIIAILSLFEFSPVHPVTNVGPLVIVIGISMLKEAIEDLRRHKKDKEVNSTQVKVLREGQWVDAPWAEIKVGEIVKVMDKSFFPADLLMLSSSDPDGVCYVETMNLDGETNLKIKKCLDQTASFTSPTALSDVIAGIECELPNNQLYTFTGNWSFDANEVYSLSPMQVLLRGCQLKNTDWVTGVVIFSGHETKVMMNSKATPSKRSAIEHQLDKLIVFLFTLQCSACLVGAIGSPEWLDFKYWYLDLANNPKFFDPDSKAEVGLVNFVTLFILYSTFIPISLYVSLEMIKFISVVYFMNKDRNIYDPISDTPALGRTSNLNEELGQVQYVFSDKTGTLTQNLMEYFKMSIGGVAYGHGVTEIQRAIAKRKGEPIPEAPKSKNFEKGFNFIDDRILDGNWVNEEKQGIILEFFRLLAVCHTVLPEGEPTIDKIQYQAASPDEAALVVAAKNFGFFFHTRTTNTIIVTETLPKNGKMENVDREYEMLAILEFNSTRKRMSTIVKTPEGRIYLYCKGADNVIYERLATTGNEYKETTMTDLEKFGSEGLRTLCCAYKEIPIKEFEAWFTQFDAARTSLQDREEKIDAVAELIETDLILFGCTAIEDKLQDGVPKSIEIMANAGIKIWVLTGDKMETAINIGYACSLLTNEQRKFIINSDTERILEAEANMNKKACIEILNEEVMMQLEKAYDDARLLGEDIPFALVIDGKALQVALQPENCELFKKLGMSCAAVVCCRVSPLQKADVTLLVKDGASKITLSIGDGANDVSMIQSAHIGVGISGNEGMQAVMASDFAIAQFRFLVDLLLVHGRWSYIRISKIIGYFFYKNVLFTMTQFWFNCFNGFSGQRFYDDWYQSAYNVLFTSVPVIVIGLFDQDVSGKVGIAFPQLYKVGQENKFFNTTTLAQWILSAMYQSVIIFFVPVLAGHPSAQGPNGQMIGHWALATTVYSCVIITVNTRIALAVSFHTIFHHIFIWGSILFWYLFIFIYSAMKPGTTGSLDSSDNVYNLIYYLMETPAFWFSIIITPVTCLIPDILLQGVTRWFRPLDHHIIQEWAAKVEDHGELKKMATKMAEGERLRKSMIKGNSPDQLDDYLSRTKSHTGYAFESPLGTSYYAPQEVVDAQKRASVFVLRKRSNISAQGLPGLNIPDKITE